MKRSAPEHAMKRFVIILLLCSLYIPALAQDTNAALLQDAFIPSAEDRILFYHQGASEEALTRPYNAIRCKSASFDVLGGNGCSLYAGLHAYQWLFGKFENMEEQTLRAKEMTALLYGENPAVQGNGAYVAHTYARERGARRATAIKKTPASIQDFFDAKSGALYLHVSWPGGGHYVNAVGCTTREMDGRDTFLLHIEDSGWGEMTQVMQSYQFTDFSPLPMNGDSLPGPEYWLPLNDYVHPLFGLWLDAD